jgi:hypothetical protein
VDIGVRIVPLARFTSPPCVYGKEINQLPAHPYVCGAALRALVPKHAYFKSGKVYRQLVCFVNSGTSEMHFIAALDKVGGMRCVLGLFEGVTTEAADGYFSHDAENRPACCCTSRRALAMAFRICTTRGKHAPESRQRMLLINLQYDAPLSRGMEGVARPMSQDVVQPTTDISSTPLLKVILAFADQMHNIYENASMFFWSQPAMRIYSILE